MLEQLHKHCRELISDKKVAGILGLRETAAGVSPFLFKEGEELEQLVVSPRYSMPFLCTALLKEYGDKKVGMVVRGCDHRGLVELHKRGKINMDNIISIGIPCSKSEAEECGCENPAPPEIVTGEKVEGVSLREREKALQAMPVNERLAYWERIFNQCIKCYGCRNACPLCLCDECRLEEGEWVSRGSIPPAFPLFHMIRAYHTIGRCVGCGQCESSCPMEIPLTTMYTLLRNDVKELLGYLPGKDKEEEISLFTDR